MVVQPRRIRVRAASICSGLIAATALAALLPTTASAANRILDNVSTAKRDGLVTLEISFSCTMRYITHFPQESGSELRVRIKPVRVCPDDALAAQRREVFHPRDADVVDLTEIIYEGDIPGGPYLTLYFTKPVAYEVKQGADFRSITVVIDTGAQPE